MAVPPAGSCKRRTLRAGVLAALVLAATGAQAVGQDGGPKRHFIFPDPAELTDADAEDIYERLREDLVRGYRLSNAPVAEAYPRWRRVNRTPYRSATHGERFVNNYVNGIGRRDYGALGPPREMPVGTVIAKDSFAVTETGEVFSGPLFVMEKMPADFAPAGGDWRYTMIMPDGSLFGVTGGQDSQKVEFCAACHAKAGEGRDHLYFVPEAYRAADPPRGE